MSQVSDGISNRGDDAWSDLYFNYCRAPMAMAAGRPSVLKARRGHDRDRRCCVCAKSVSSLAVFLASDDGRNQIV